MAKKKTKSTGRPMDAVGRTSILKEDDMTNFIGVGKALLDEGITIKPELSMRQVRLICYGLEEVIDSLNDGELLLDLHDTLGNRGPVSEAGSREELRELLHGIGAVVHGPDYYKED